MADKGWRLLGTEEISEETLQKLITLAKHCTDQLGPVLRRWRPVINARPAGTVPVARMKYKETGPLTCDLRAATPRGEVRGTLLSDYDEAAALGLEPFIVILKIEMARTRVQLGIVGTDRGGRA